MEELFSVEFVICMLTGFSCFWLFLKSVDWFEKI